MQNSCDENESPVFQVSLAGEDGEKSEDVRDSIIEVDQPTRESAKRGPESKRVLERAQTLDPFSNFGNSSALRRHSSASGAEPSLVNYSEDNAFRRERSASACCPSNVKLASKRVLCMWKARASSSASLASSPTTTCKDVPFGTSN